MFISRSAPQDEKRTSIVSRQAREERKERVAPATPFDGLRRFEKTSSMPWKFRIFQPQMSQMDADGTAGGHILVRRQKI
jgi:hypothetical protein